MPLALRFTVRPNAKAASRITRGEYYMMLAQP
jgi:hypothetical protein